MSKLPDIRFVSPGADVASRLARWLAEWELECRLRAAPLPRDPPPDAGADAAAPWIARAGPAAADCRAFPASEPPVARGQIRLLAPDGPATRRRPIYIAILAFDGDGFLAAPHSPFAEPAVAGELLMDRATLGMRVLCLWSARRITRTTAQASWVTDALTDRELADALAVLRHVREGARLPPALTARVGAPLAHPLDPRREYLEEASDEMDSIAVASRCGVVLEGRNRFAYATVAGDTPAARAAEARPPFGAAHLFAVTGRNSLVHASPAGSAGSAAIRVLARDGQPSAELDGCRFRSPAGTLSSPIRDGLATVDWDCLAGTPELVMPDGSLLALHRA